MTREELKAEALINLGSEPAPKEWEKLPCIKEQMPSCIGGEVSLQRFVGTDICAWFVGIGGLWEPQSDYFRVSLPPAEGAEQRIRVRNILQDFYRRGEYELEQAEEDIMRLFQPQPTAEGAEEITAEEFIRDKIRKKYELKGDMGALWMHICNAEEALRWAHEFATLHAQRIAEKMVEEGLREELKVFYLYVDEHWALGQLTSNITEVIKEYLEDKGKGKTLKSTHN